MAAPTSGDSPCPRVLSHVFCASFRAWTHRTVAFLFYPELVSFKRATVKISSDEGTRGFTYFDQRHHPKLGGGCWVAMDIDTDWAAVMVQDLMCEYNDQQLQTRMQHFRAIRSVSR
jgi:hypothetical protein